MLATARLKLSPPTKITPRFGFTANGDGSFLVSTTIGAPDPANENGGFRAKAFKREEHTSKYQTGQGNEYPYTAVKVTE